MLGDFRYEIHGAHFSAAAKRQRDRDFYLAHWLPRGRGESVQAHEDSPPKPHQLIIN